jgi:hypothetical protein
MAAKEWEAALEAIDKAIDAHKLQHFRGHRTKGLENWRQDAATVEMEQPCNVISELWAAKATILAELGRGEESEALRKRTEEPVGYQHQDV